MNIFEKIITNAKKSYTTFSMNNNWIGSIKDFGALTKIYAQPVIASDTWKISHNIIVKLPPLTAPAFTRIKGIVNTFYCSYASVWKHWNSFISDKPDDVFMNRTLKSAYANRFVEPCVKTSVISMICKIAKGNFAKLDYHLDSEQNLVIDFYPVYNQSVATSNPAYNSTDFLNSISWSYHNGLRHAVFSDFSSQISTDGYLITLTDQSRFYVEGGSSYVSNNYGAQYFYDDKTLTALNSIAVSLGFYDIESYLIYCCQSVVRNLESIGVPCDLMAQTPQSYYEDHLYNLLNHICESSIWHNFYRDEQNQSPEFSYEEVNGHLYTLNSSDALVTSNKIMKECSGWQIRVCGLPLNDSTPPFWYSINRIDKAFSLLTGFCLRESVLDQFTSATTVTNVLIIPTYYNGLLVQKYRNFSKDYFTSACVDPMMGAVNVQVPSTIEALRTASKLEEFLERSATAKDFYHFMVSTFGTNPESTRYKKPLLLGTQIVPVQIGEQLQTSESTTSSPLGERAGVADGYGNGGTANHYFNEHGFIVSYLSFIIDGQYMQGLPHWLNHHLQLDYPLPDFANLGAESISTDEVYFSNNRSISMKTMFNEDLEMMQASRTQVNGSVGTQINVPSSEYKASISPSMNNLLGLDSVIPTGPFDTYEGKVISASNYPSSLSQTIFGYVPRYSKWKWCNDVVCGQLRDEMEYWHTFRKFHERPFISHSFVSYQDAGYLSDINRIFAVENDNSDKFIVDIFNNCSVRRCLPLVANPQLD